MNTFLAALLALTLTPAQTDPKAAAKPAKVKAADVTLDQAVVGVQKFYEKVSDFKANFRQTVKRKNMPRPRKLRGKVAFKKPGMMRWNYQSPEKVLYVSDGKVLWNYQPEDGIAYKLNVKDSELYNALKFLFGQGDLRKEFKITLMPAKSGLVRLKLTPKVKQTNYKHIILHVDPTKFEIRQSELADPLGGSVSKVTFSKIVYAPIPAKVFTSFKPKKGVRVQDLTVKKASPSKAKPSKPAPSKP